MQELNEAINQDETQRMIDFIEVGRSRMGLTKKNLADRIGVNYSTVRNWSKGRSRPNDEYVRMMASLFGSDFDLDYSTEDLSIHQRSVLYYLIDEYLHTGETKEDIHISFKNALRSHSPVAEYATLSTREWDTVLRIYYGYER